MGFKVQRSVSSLAAELLLEENAMFSGLAVPQTIPIRRWTAVVAFTVQAATIVTLVGFPLIYPQNLPQAFSARQIFTPAVFQAVRTVQSQTGEHGTGFSQPRPLVVNTGHRFIFRNQDQDTSGLQGPSFGFVSGPPGVLDSILSINSQPVIISPRAGTHATRRSVMMEGNLIHRVEPRYPTLAKQARIQGTVIVKAIISRNGVIEQTQVVSGPGLLGHAALEAIRQWRYRPYILNGEPVEVETQVIVRFVLN